MSLLKRGNVWWTYFYVDGLRHQYSTGTANRRRAEAVEAKLKQEANDRRFQLIQADPSITFGGLAAHFVASGIARPHHLYHLKFLLPFFGETQAAALTRAMAEEFRLARQAEKPDRPCKDATVNRDLAVLRHILYWAVDERLILANPLARLKMARERRTHRQVLSVEEEQKLLTAASPHLKPIITAALDTGMRRGEITGQLWEHIDFPRKLLFVTKSKTPEGESREIPLSARLHDWLAEHQQPSGPVFGYHGQPIRIIKTAWRTALKHSGIRRLRFHDLRHSFNTRLMEAGVMREVRMALMGHSSGQNVQSIYTHVELPAKREAIRRLEAWVNQQLQKQKETDNARNENTNRSETGCQSGDRGAQGLAQEDPRRGGPGASGEAEGRDRRG